MGDLTIGMNSYMDTTVVSNQFIDRYMPSANGEYVKIYLYMLRCVNHNASTFSPEAMARQFDHTVSYVMTALKYWESQGLLKLFYDEENTLTHIDFLDLSRPDEGNGGSSRSENDTEPGAAEPFVVPGEDPTLRRHSYTLDEKRQFAEDENFNSAKFVTQTYFGKPLGPSQLENLMYIYDGLGFDNDLIDFLVEHCVSKGKRSMRYVEATAIAWAKQGINTVALARERLASFSQLSVAIMQEFGISTRSLVAEERAYIDKWTKEYHIPDELIIEACRRTMRATKKGSFDYADTILTNWNKEGIRTMEDVQKADQAHRQKTARSGQGAKKPAKNAPFPQREYDMDSLERQLLHIN